MGAGSGCLVMFVTVLTIESNYMALCFIECSSNTEQSHPLGVLIKLSVSLSVCVCVCCMPLTGAHNYYLVIKKRRGGIVG